MPPITGLHTFTSPVDPTDLNDNFDIVQDAFNDSAIRDDETAVQTLAGPLEGILRDTEFAKSVKLSTIGAVGDGTTNNAAVFSALTPGTYLIPPGLYAFTTNATVAEGVVLVFAEGARLTRTGSATLAIAGEIVAGRYKIFEAEASFLTGSRPKNRAVYPEWWGAKADGSTDDTVALNRAFAVVGLFAATAAAAGVAGGGVVKLGPGTYVVATADYVEVVSNFTLSGAGAGATVLKHGTSELGAMLRIDAKKNVVIEDVGFDYANGPSTNTGSIVALAGSGVSDVTVRNCRFFDSNPPPVDSPPASVQDRFAISFGNVGPMERIRVTDNECRDRLQLTSGGGAGVKYLWIERNYVEDAEQNAIAVTSNLPYAVFEYVYIRANYVKQPRAVGIYVGEDAPTSHHQTFRSVYIVDNVVDGFSANSNGNNFGIFCSAVDTDCSEYEIRGNTLRGWPATNHSGIALINRLGGTRHFRRVTILHNLVEGFEKALRTNALRESVIAENVLTGGILVGETVTKAGTGLLFEGSAFEQVSVVGNRSSGFIFGCSIAGGKFDLAGNSLGNNTLNDPFHVTAALSVKPGSGQTASINAVGNFFGDDQATHTQEYGIYHDPAAAGSFDCRYVDNDLRGVTVSGGELFNVDHNQRVLDNHTSAATGLIGPRWERVATASLTFTAPGAVPGESPAGATVTVTGARAGDTVQVTAPGAIPAGFVAPYGWVSANDTVTVVWMQVAGTAAAAPSGTYRVRVSKF